MKLAKIAVVVGTSAGLLVLSAASASAASLPKPRFDAVGNLVPTPGLTGLQTGFLCGAQYHGAPYLTNNSWGGSDASNEYLQCAAATGERVHTKKPVLVEEGTSACSLLSNNLSTSYNVTIDRKGILVLTCARTLPVQS